MFIFGGRSPGYHKNTQLESTDWKTMLLNDLWCYVYSSKAWVELRGTGITPSPRADMGGSCHALVLVTKILQF